MRFNRRDDTDATTDRRWVLAGTRSAIRYQLEGVVLIVGPWNSPFGFSVVPLAFQHGNEPEDFLLAHTFALVALGQRRP